MSDFEKKRDAAELRAFDQVNCKPSWPTVRDPAMNSPYRQSALRSRRRLGTQGDAGAGRKERRDQTNAARFKALRKPDGRLYTGIATTRDQLAIADSVDHAEWEKIPEIPHRGYSMSYFDKRRTTRQLSQSASQVLAGRGVDEVIEWTTPLAWHVGQ
jgi:hypothetical protein